VRKIRQETCEIDRRSESKGGVERPKEEDRVGVMAGLIEVLEQQSTVSCRLSTISSFGIEILKQQSTGHCVSVRYLLQV
jgi:hypothetical protein